MWQAIKSQSPGARLRQAVTVHPLEAATQQHKQHNTTIPR
jgi:hypothetical protein